MRKLIPVILLALSIHSAYSQQANIWYFGEEAGLNFNTLTNNLQPAVITDGKMKAEEGCGSISDINGNLLFYTNGITVYNRRHVIMLNGDGLLGHLSSMQSGFIVQVPGNDSIFYVFTTDAFENNFINGYRYSVVNMKHDNGYGEVISKNNVLWSSSTERMTAVRHGNGNDVWLITNDNNSNIYRAWLIDCNGLHMTPVVSATGEVLNLDNLNNVGMLKISPDGKQLCQAHFTERDIIVGGVANNFFQLFDFDNMTGVISNAKKINFPDISYLTCEYSPNSQLLYLSVTDTKAIDQFEPRLATAADIETSRIRIPTNAPVWGIQLAPDGKIYLSRQSSYLDVINDPDIKGTGCNYGFEQVYLNGKTSKLQLPSSINDATTDPYNNFQYEVIDSCSGTVRFTAFTLLNGPFTWHWDFGDGNTSDQQNPVHQFTPPQQSYLVKLTITPASSCMRKLQAMNNVYPSGQVSKASFDVINRCDSGYVRFINTSGQSMLATGSFTWDFGDGNTSNDINPVYSYTSPGNYTVRLLYTTVPSCLNDIATHTVDLQAYPISVTANQTILVSQSVHLFATAQNAISYKWSPATWLDNTDIMNPMAVPLDDITYTVTATYQNGCVAKDSVFIKVLPLDGIFIPSGFTPNNDGKNETIYPLFSTQLTLKEFSVFNRWGQKVFTTQKRGYGWDGKLVGLLQQTGVYIYSLRLTDLNGKVVDKKGTFTLIR
jgi:gliding motility-associated-like protein